MTVDMGQPDPRFGPAGAAAPGMPTGTTRDAAEFRRQMEAAAEAIAQRHHQLFMRVMAELLTVEVQGNPVGNPTIWKQPRDGYVGGHSRRNWQVTLTPAAPEQAGADASGQTAVTDGYAAIAQIPRGTPRAYLVNPVPYMERLDQGWSRQAPAGWIGAALQQVMAKYERAQ